MAKQKGVFEENTDQMYTELLMSTSTDTGIPVPTVAHVVFFALGSISQMVQDEEPVEIKVDYLGKIRHKGNGKSTRHLHV